MAGIGRINQALKRHNVAISLASSNAEKALAHFYRGAAYFVSNNLDEAIRDYELVLELHPFFFPATFALTEAMAEMTHVTPDTWRRLLSQFISIRDSYSAPVAYSQADNAELLVAQFSLYRGDLYRAMFNCADKLREYSLAWEYLTLANEIDEQTHPPFNAAESLQRSLSIMNIFRDDVNWFEGFGHSSDVPIFIVGFLRSGSTLLEHVLDAHPGVVGIGEDSVFNGMLPMVIKDILAIIKESSTVEAVATVVQHYAEEILRKMKEKADQMKGPDKGPARYIVDKMVFNFRNIGLIHLLFPHATIIHVMRDPMDDLLSCYSRKFEAPSKCLLFICKKKCFWASFFMMRRVCLIIALAWTRNMDYLVAEYSIYLEIVHHFDRINPYGIVHLLFEKIAANPERVREADIKWKIYLPL